MRLIAAAVLLCILPERLAAQGAISGDLWRVAAGTQTSPAALRSGPSGVLWNPAATMPDSSRIGIALESFHAPEEVGVTGAVVALMIRSPVGTLAFAWGRMGLDDIIRTETSPEGTGGLVPVYAHVVTAGLSRRTGARTTAGVAVRLLSGRLADRDERRVGLDAGIGYQAGSRLRLGAATRFFDPSLGSAATAASYTAGAELRAWTPALGAVPGSVLLRYGFTAEGSEGSHHLLGAGILIGNSLSVDAGAARESRGGESAWRTRMALGLGVGAYQIEVGRDGGVNGFDSTWRFSLAAEVR